MPHDLRLLAIDVATNFVFSGSGRIERENDPDNTPAPRVFVAGCVDGNLARVRHDLSEPTVQAVLDLVAHEPPWTDPSVPLRCLPDIKHALSSEGPVEKAEPGFLYELRNNLVYPTGAKLVTSESAEAINLLFRLADEGMPESLCDAGFKSIGDFWEPWCVALEGDDIASLAFAGRLSPLGAEIGVHTFPPFRGRGLAAAVTAAWSSLPSLEDHALFYSARRTNLSSQRVASRLNLRPLGASIHIY